MAIVPTDAQRIAGARAIAVDVACWVATTKQDTSQAACGAALAAAHVGLAAEDGALLALARACVDVAVTVRSPLIGLHGGVAEVGWTVAHLRGLGVLAASRRDDALLGALDGFLREKIVAPATRFDLFNGLAGFGVYALERGDHELLAAVVIAADRRRVFAEGIGDCLFEIDGEEGWADFGLAHGLAGLLPVLASAVRLDVERSLAARLLAGLRATLIERAFLDEATSIDGLHRDGRPGRVVSRRPLGLCYGALGMASALATAARCTGDEAALAHASQLVDRAARVDAALPDAFLCHGQAGAAVLLRRHRSEAAREAEAAMLARLYANHDPAAPFGGFRVVESGRGADLLTGASGVALALLPAAAEWDRILGASTLADA